MITFRRIRGRIIPIKQKDRDKIALKAHLAVGAGIAAGSEIVSARLAPPGASPFIATAKNIGSAAKHVWKSKTFRGAGKTVFSGHARYMPAQVGIMAAGIALDSINSHIAEKRTKGGAKGIYRAKMFGAGLLGMAVGSRMARPSAKVLLRGHW